MGPGSSSASSPGGGQADDRGSWPLEPSLPKLFNRSGAAMRMITGAALAAATLVLGCQRGAETETPGEQVRSAQKRSEQALERAKDAQEKATREQEQATGAQEDLVRIRSEVTQAEQKAQREAEE